MAATTETRQNRSGTEAHLGEEQRDEHAGHTREAQKQTHKLERQPPLPSQPKIQPGTMQDRGKSNQPTQLPTIPPNQSLSTERRKQRATTTEPSHPSRGASAHRTTRTALINQSTTSQPHQQHYPNRASPEAGTQAGRQAGRRRTTCCGLDCQTAPIQRQGRQAGNARTLALRPGLYTPYKHSFPDTCVRPPSATRLKNASAAARPSVVKLLPEVTGTSRESVEAKLPSKLSSPVVAACTKQTKDR